ncbi:MAG: hypothetical protein HZA19_05100 [Nitrospirae bacterium]|nr:hypothetical protein [Nitrospirota bacterium]
MGLPVRRGIPQNVGGLVDIVSSPVYATGVGLTLYALKQEREETRPRKLSGGNLFEKVFLRMKGWFKEFF